MIARCRDASGQATLMVVWVLIALAAAALLLGGVARGIGAGNDRQRAADLAALSGARAMHARFGGDEFCFLIPDMDHFSVAWLIAERFREAVERFDWSTEDPRLAEMPVHVDVGVVCLNLGPVTERRNIARQLAHDLLARADKLMYEAKGERASHVYPLRVRIEHGQLVELAPDEYPD